LVVNAGAGDAVAYLAEILLAAAAVFPIAPAAALGALGY